MLIVADTGPLITLIQLEQLRILEGLFPDYLLPDQGINCFGSIGVLIKGKRSGLIPEIKPFLLEMRRNKRYISDELFFKTLKDEGENP